MNNINFNAAKRVVIKIGSSVITNDGNNIDKKQLELLIKQIAVLISEGKEIVLVSSGAIAAGMVILGYKKRPKELSDLRVAASVGQMALAQAYESLFTKYKLRSSLILLTHDDLSGKKSFLNARTTISKLLDKNIIPVVNENDTIADDEIRFGDNDTLAAMVANLIEADYLLLLTDQAGLFSDDPAQNKDAKLIKHAFIDDEKIMEAAKDSKSSTGTGGMVTKINAAKRASMSGTNTIILSGRKKNILLELDQHNMSKTLIQSKGVKIASKKIWMNNHLKTKGKLFINEKTEEEIYQGKSIFPNGALRSEGIYKRGEIIKFVNTKQKVIAKGLINYNNDEVEKICGHGSNEIELILGYINESNLTHKDNIALLRKTTRKS